MGYSRGYSGGTGGVQEGYSGGGGVGGGGAVSGGDCVSKGGRYRYCRQIRLYVCRASV